MSGILRTAGPDAEILTGFRREAEEDGLDGFAGRHVPTDFHVEAAFERFLRWPGGERQSDEEQEYEGEDERVARHDQV